MGFVDGLLREFVAEAVLVDGDEREAARCERVAEHRVDASADPRRAAGDLAQDQVAGFGVFQVMDCELAPLALVDRRQPEAVTVAADDPKHQLGSLRQFLERVGEPALPLLFGATEDAVADAERAALATLNDLEPRRWSFGVPGLRHREDMAAIVDLADAEHRDFWDAARLMEGPAARMVDQP